jgi:hypothetical protein
MKVVVEKPFKEKTLNIVGLTNNIMITHAGKFGNGLLCLGECFEHPTHGPIKAYCRPHLQFPVNVAATGFARNVVEPFIVAYWACQETFDTTRANCHMTMPEVSVKVGTATHKIGIPTITNTKPLRAGDEIVVLKMYPAAEPHAVPDAKRQKSAQPIKEKLVKGKGKGKGTGSGKSAK